MNKLTHISKIILFSKQSFGELTPKRLDGGNTWNIQPTVAKGFSSVFFTDSNTGYAVGGLGTIMKTTNGGSQDVEEEIVLQRSRFTIYPNPATNNITIASNRKLSEIVNVSIFNINGEKISQDNFQNQNLFEINVSKLKKGIYLLKIISSGKSEFKKLMIQ